MASKVASGIVLMLLLTSMISSVLIIQPVRAEPGTIYIRADGSVDPSTAPISTVDNTTYTFTGNIYDSIVIERDNIVVDGAGYIVQGAGSGTGIDLSSRHNVTVCNAEVTGFTNGIGLGGASNTISGNNITYNDYGGILLGDTASGNLIYANYIARCQYGIWFWDSSGNTILENDIKDNERGIYLYAYSHLNVITGNILRKNDYGVYLQRHVVYGSEPEDNRIFHNNFIENSNQVYSDSVLIENFWDNEYPSGGNYWSDYAGADLYSGPYQNETGSDGIGDTAYIFDPYNKDNYPLMNTWTPPDFSITVSPASLTIQKGNGDTVVIKITSIEGFDRPVQLSVYGMPPDVVTNINPEQITLPPDGSTNSTLTVSVDTTAIPGSYTLNTVGISIILINSVVIPLVHSVSIPLEITALPPPENQPPIGDAGLDKSASSGDLVQFDSSDSHDPDGTIVSYKWDFSDGTTEEGKKLSHRFRGTQNAPKTYTATLTVEDDDGATNMDTVQVTITPLTRSLEISKSPMYAKMTVTYNWVDINNNENIYIISKILIDAKGFVGTLVPTIWVWESSYTLGEIPDVEFLDYLFIGGSHMEKTYEPPFPTKPVIGMSPSIAKRTFTEGTFEGIQVKGSDVMSVYAQGLTLKVGWPPIDIKLFEFSSTSFEPQAPPAEQGLLQKLLDKLLNLLVGKLGSPGELRVYDSEGRVTGLVNGEVRQEIPNSIYFNDTIMILSTSGSYRFEVAGTEDGSYGLMLASLKKGNITSFTANDIPISTNAMHQYVVNWTALAQGAQGVNIQVDPNGDGTFEKTFVAGNELNRDEFMLQVSLTETFPIWIVGAAVAAIAITTAAVTVIWRRQKQHPTKGKQN